MKITLHLNDKHQYELVGELTFQSVPAIYRQIEQMIKENGEILVDLSKVTRSDSAGVAMLVEWVRDARQHGKSIQFYNIPGQMLAIAKVSGLDVILPLS